MRVTCSGAGNMSGPHLAHSSRVLGTWSKDEVLHRMASTVPLSMMASKLSDAI